MYVFRCHYSGSRLGGLGGWVRAAPFPGVRCPVSVRVGGGGDASPIYLFCPFLSKKGSKTVKKHEVSVNYQIILKFSLIFELGFYL